MTQVPILHLGNVVADSSSGRIIQRLVTNLGEKQYSWHIGGVCGLGDMQEEFARMGAQVVDFSDRQNGSRYLAKRIREYVNVRAIRILHTHSPRARLAVNMALVDRRHTRHLATEHLLYAPKDRRWGFVFTLFDRLTLYPADQVVTVSQKMRGQLVALPGLSASRVTAIQNAIDCESYFAPEQRDPCRSEFGLIPECRVIGYTGRLDRVKRLDLLLEGFCGIVAQHPEARLLIIGEGEQRARLETMASDLGISNTVIWTGFRQDIPRLLAAMDLYVQPSTNEGLSLSILEAMAAGKPVIATDVGGAREVLRHEKTGILIPPGSSQAVEAALVDLLDHPDKRAALSQAARKYVNQEFGVHRMVEGYRRVYETLASQLYPRTNGPVERHA
ncbi:MAG: glycosyltransferase family 4 protein [Candidatus Promineifilaceae bacterium]|jgi:glycosyltransferase involved in cell wall biosynthesis